MRGGCRLATGVHVEHDRTGAGAKHHFTRRSRGSPDHGHCLTRGNKKTTEQQNKEMSQAAAHIGYIAQCRPEQPDQNKKPHPIFGQGPSDRNTFGSAQGVGLIA